MGAGELPVPPLKGEGVSAVLITVHDLDKAAVTKIARDLHQLGFEILATRGTADWLNRNKIPARAVNKVSEGAQNSEPHVVDLIANHAVAIVINTPLGKRANDDGQLIRAAAISHKVPLMTTLSAAQAAVQGIRALKQRGLEVRSLQAHHQTE